MHWFWITLFYKGLVVLTVHFISPPPSLVVEAGLHNDNAFTADFNLFDNQLFYKYGETSQNNEKTYLNSRSKRHIEDGADLSEETSSPATIHSSSPDYLSITETLTNEATSDVENDFREASSDTVDTYNGGMMDIFHQYPVKKYSKYSEFNPPKFGKTKNKPKTSNGSIMGETLKIVEEKIDINLKKDDDDDDDDIDDGEKTLNGSVVEGNSNDNETIEETTDLNSGENVTMVVIGNSTEVRNETSTVGNDDDELILSDEPIKTDQITENIVGGRKETTKNRVNINVTTSTATEDQKITTVVQNASEISVENKVEESVVRTTSVEPFNFNNNRVAAATSSDNKERVNQSGLDAGSITGITLGIVVISGLFGAISFVLYRRRYLNKPQALNDKSSNLDSSGYIDDTSFRENSEEMYSLDNDSFLNSLEAMTIQNYWTENVKHTKL